MNHGVQKLGPPRATGYQPTEFKGSLPKRCWCLGLGQNALSCPNPTPQNAIGVRPSVFGGFGTPAPGTTSQSIPLRLPAWFHWSFLFLVNLAALPCQHEYPIEYGHVNAIFSDPQIWSSWLCFKVEAQNLIRWELQKSVVMHMPVTLWSCFVILGNNLALRRSLTLS